MLLVDFDLPELTQPRTQPVVLVAEDEVLVRNFVCLLLQREGYHVLAAADGREAIQLSRAYTGNIQLLLTDVMMPHMNGLALADQLIDERPGVRVLVMSGKLSNESPEWNIRLPFLRKPFEAAALREELRKVLNSPPPEKKSH